MAQDQKIWQEYSRTLKELLNLDYSPVALSCIVAGKSTPSNKKVRICRAILEAGKGEIIELDKTNNACFGASWHLGFHKIKDPKIAGMVKKFVVEGEKLFCSYQALDNLISQMQEVPDNSANCVVLAPLEKVQDEPQLVIFIADAEAACRLLTLAIFDDGKMPAIKIGGPTCRMSIIYPLLSNEINISFYDYTARKLCHVDKDKLLISIPYKKIPQLTEAIAKCTAGTAKVEFPPEFRQFLQQRLAVPGKA